MNAVEVQFHSIDEAKTSIGWIADFLKSKTLDPVVRNTRISGCSSAKNPKPNTLTFVQASKKLDLSTLSICALVLCRSADRDKFPDGPVYMVVDNPHAAFAAVAREIYRQIPHDAGTFYGKDNVSAFVHSTARIADDVVIEPGAVIGAEVEIGAGSIVRANASIDSNCRIGRNCSVGLNSSVQFSLVGDNVTIHTGARIGQDGFGFIPGSNGLEKMPQLGRVIIQDNVEIGANTTIDRGALDDTVIGEGTKIDNLVQIAHNVIIGRNCAIAAFAGLSGSSQIGDGCMIGGRVGISDHISVGNNVQLAATSSVMNDIPDGEKWAGTPAQPIKAFFREQATLRRLVKPNKPKSVE